MSKMLWYIAAYFLLGLVYSYHLSEEATQAYKAEEQRAIQKRNTVVSYMAKKRKEDTKYTSDELRTKAKRTFAWFIGSSVLFGMIGWSAHDPHSR